MMPSGPISINAKVFVKYYQCLKSTLGHFDALKYKWISNGTKFIETFLETHDLLEIFEKIN